MKEAEKLGDLESPYFCIVKSFDEIWITCLWMRYGGGKSYWKLLFPMSKSTRFVTVPLILRTNILPEGYFWLCLAWVFGLSLIIALQVAWPAANRHRTVPISCVVAVYHITKENSLCDCWERVLKTMFSKNPWKTLRCSSKSFTTMIIGHVRILSAAARLQEHTSTASRELIV